ncbi:MAG: hypothetical protein HC834_00765 [Rhodospirillales bacterium]|nr:hypothetical protein [Rhodospirillales bacterium]
MPAIDLAAVRSEIEQEREWREAELRALKNNVAGLRQEQQREIARKALVVMLYAHFEGVAKALFSIYVKEINRLAISLAEAHPALAAAAMAKVFGALRNPSSKCKEFARSLPDDTKLHRYARDREFLEQTADFGARLLHLEPESVVDTESNLKPVVLRKILYRLGFDPAIADSWEGAVHELLRRRNDVAHGTGTRGVDAKEYERLERAVKEVVDALVLALTDALSRQAYYSAGNRPSATG